MKKVSIQDSEDNMTEMTTTMTASLLIAALPALRWLESNSVRTVILCTQSTSVELIIRLAAMVIIVYMCETCYEPSSRTCRKTKCTAAAA